MLRVVAALAFIEVALSTPAFATTFSEGKAAYDRNQISEAEKIYLAVVADPNSNAADRASAHRELARISWLIDGNAAAALEQLASARRAGDKPCDTAEMTARVFREASMFDRAAAESAALIRQCDEPRKLDEIRIHLIGATLDLAASSPTNRPKLLRAAAAEAAKFSEAAGIEAARVRLEIALLTGDAEKAVSAWKEFFWLEEEDAPEALLGKGATAMFRSGLRSDASVKDRLQLAELLMRAGFATASQRFAEAHQLPSAASGDATLRKLQAYWRARKSLQAELLVANRQIARGGKTPAVLKAAADRLDRAEAAWRARLLAGLQSPKGDPDNLLKVHYGIFGTGRGATSGYPSIHRGHVTEDRELAVSQYGKTAKVRFVAVDNMIANGFESWLWDGGPMVGGWQNGNLIASVRPGYVNSPLNAFDLTQDSARRREIITRQAQRAAEDVNKLKATPVATLTGLNDRLQLQTVDRVAAAVRARTKDAASFRKAFLAEYSRANFEQSIEVHEGRHAINEVRGLHARAEQAVTEYEAKLSELALSTYPRMALRNMNSNVEGDGPHDRAVAKLFDQYRIWMDAHSTEVLGFDPAVPALAQLDKLTDDQIREIARSLDPLANGRPSPNKL